MAIIRCATQHFGTTAFIVTEGLVILVSSTRSQLLCIYLLVYLCLPFLSVLRMFDTNSWLSKFVKFGKSKNYIPSAFQKFQLQARSPKFRLFIETSPLSPNNPPTVPRLPKTATSAPSSLD